MPSNLNLKNSKLDWISRYSCHQQSINDSSDVYLSRSCQCDGAGGPRTIHRDI